jgi:hypothetical protein
LPPLRRYYSFHDAESDDDTSFAKRVDAVTFKKLLLYCFTFAEEDCWRLSKEV